MRELSSILKAWRRNDHSLRCYVFERTNGCEKIVVGPLSRYHPTRHCEILVEADRGDEGFYWAWWLELEGRFSVLAMISHTAPSLSVLQSSYKSYHKNALTSAHAVMRRRFCTELPGPNDPSLHNVDTFAYSQASQP
ncbi:hypothetical protein SCHPADRAFT_516850 [Schizopora paradoxa]|uniref:Uncharacterized protein n=1 Tax=Schizopora paradoxa TaxID=27342 RepID=A0A0H2RFZ9_9AGAM|nr:hypothetical protein SCHPADRAFT_516850 [Schizopora paradoxa]